MRQIALNFIEMHQLEIRLNSASVEVEVEDELGKNKLGMSSPKLSLVGWWWGCLQTQFRVKPNIVELGPYKPVLTQTRPYNTFQNCTKL